MERNVMGELNVYRGSGAKTNFSEIARMLAPGDFSR